MCSASSCARAHKVRVDAARNVWEDMVLSQYGDVPRDELENVMDPRDIHWVVVRLGVPKEVAAGVRARQRSQSRVEKVMLEVDLFLWGL